MWPQILIALLSTLGVGIPLIANRLHEIRVAAEIAEAARTGIPPVIRPKRLKARAKGTDAPVLEAHFEQLTVDERFQRGLEELERRALENSDHNIYGYIAALLEELRALDAKLRLNGIDHQTRLTYTKYVPMVKKLVDLTAPNYYGDFVRNPDHWNDPRRMRLQVELSVVAVAREAARDIKRLNSAQELDFQVTVESLVGKGTESQEPRDSDAVLEELLAGDELPLDELQGSLEELKLVVAGEAAALERRQALDRKIEEERKLALTAGELRGGSKQSLELQSTESRLMAKLISKELFKQSFTVYGSGDPGTRFLVEHSNSVTGERVWKNFPDAYEAADWVDKATAELEKKHSFKCGCVYCRNDS